MTSIIFIVCPLFLKIERFLFSSTTDPPFWSKKFTKWKRETIRQNIARMTTNFKAKPLICRKLILVSFLSFSGCFCLAKKSSQQQFFRVKPHDVEVGQGGSVIISCEVGNRRGRVQWTKDGLTLGKSYCKCQNSS